MQDREQIVVLASIPFHRSCGCTGIMGRMHSVEDVFKNAEISVRLLPSVKPPYRERLIRGIFIAKSIVCLKETIKSNAVLLGLSGPIRSRMVAQKARQPNSAGSQDQRQPYATYSVANENLATLSRPIKRPCQPTLNKICSQLLRGHDCSNIP